jgi:hypothetical protein
VSKVSGDRHRWVHNLSVLPNGTVSWSAGLRFAGTAFLASFDVPPNRVPDLVRALEIPPESLSRTGALYNHTLRVPTPLAVNCKLGAVQRTAEQQFIPLVVDRVSATEQGG